MTDLTWLKMICSESEIRAKALGHPWTVVRGGETWTVASNGFVLAAIRGDHGFPATDSDAPNFEVPMVEPSVAPRPLPLGELRALALPWLAPEIPDCEACGNTGNVPCGMCGGDGSEECECHCGDVHDTTCDRCNGTGDVGCTKCVRGVEREYNPRPVKIGDSVFDLRVLAPLLANIPGDLASFRQHVDRTRAGFFDIGEWHVIVAPLRSVGDDKLIDAPRIEFATEVAA